MQQFTHVTNPETGRLIKIDGDVYAKLIDNGYVLDNKGELTKARTNKHKSKVEYVDYDHQEHVYLVQVSQDVYKIGRSTNIDNRLKAHRRDADLFRIHLVLAVDHCIRTEKLMISAFNDRFSVVSYKGKSTREYFTGDVGEMITCVLDIYSKTSGDPNRSAKETSECTIL